MLDAAAIELLHVKLRNALPVRGILFLQLQLVAFDWGVDLDAFEDGLQGLVVIP